ncbi:sugar phosphate isomerase/epimerase [Lachnoclostridium pacaense]|uniref:sugar phosphate isomerase/epimerase family protein n=1 Tax=Enterocloster hominis (ex Hitch et al. 2024) TaxID=1917870 RepID=UPI001D10EB03|nr:sugar phosphate isomerase/epimerase family protein [Lachnoclostridium pacaense]MCC2875070.1 sugar phosphate isomerase/epimerase [Lachnoclostridium pacaense]
MKRKLGVCEWCLPVQGTALWKRLKNCGIDSIQIDTGLYEAGVPLIFPEVREAYLEAAREAQIELCSASNMSLCDYGMVHPESDSAYAACREIIQKSIDALSAMNIPLLMVPSFFDGEIKDEDGFRNTAKMLKWACEYGADKGVVISWENGMSVEENLRMIDMVGKDNFGLGFDSQMPHACNGYYVPDMIRHLKGHINMLHIKDGKGSQMEGAELGMAHYGDGDTDFNESVKALKEIGYSGCIVTENSYNDRIFYQGDGNPFGSVREDVRRFKLAFAD